MRPSANCANLIKSFESCRLTAYLPTENDKWTIGFGQTGLDIKQGTVWTQKQADDRFTATLAAFGNGVSFEINPAKTLQREFDALTSLAFNIGLAAFGSSTVLKLHNAGQKQQAGQHFLDWIHQGGIVLNGLVRRRTAEQAMYLGTRV